MKKLFFAVLAALLLFPSCGGKEEKSSDSSKERAKQEKAFKKAQEYYDKKGFEKFVEYVADEGYFAVKDSGYHYATPLLIAIAQGQHGVDNIRAFMEKGASLAETDSRGYTGLDYALEYFDEDIAAWAVYNAPDSCWVNVSAGEYPAMRLIRSCHDYDIIRTALRKTPNINRTSTDSTEKNLLMYAAQCNSDVRIIKDLLDKKADINKKNKNEWTALMYAARYNPNPMIADYLLLSGADASPNSAGLTPVMLAASSGHTDVLAAVLKRTDAVNAQTKEGKTAIMYACETQQLIPIIRCLQENFADINLKDQNGKTALMYALQTYQTIDVPALLITAGADCTGADNTGKTVKEYLEANTRLKDSSLVDIIAEKTKR